MEFSPYSYILHVLELFNIILPLHLRVQSVSFPFRFSKENFVKIRFSCLHPCFFSCSSLNSLVAGPLINLGLQALIVFVNQMVKFPLYYVINETNNRLWVVSAWLFLYTGTIKTKSQPSYLINIYAVCNAHIKSNNLAAAVMLLACNNRCPFQIFTRILIYQLRFLMVPALWRPEHDLKWTTISYFIFTSPMTSTVMSYYSIINIDCSCFWLLILIMKANEKHYFSNLFYKVLYMFRTGPLSIIRSISTLYTRSRYLSC